MCKWNQLDQKLQNSLTFSSSKHSLLHFICPIASLVYDIQHACGLKLLTRLSVGLGHLREHKCLHNFNDTINPICFCRTNNIGSVKHFLCNTLTTNTIEVASLISSIKMTLIFYHALMLTCLRCFFSLVSYLI